MTGYDEIVFYAKALGIVIRTSSAMLSDYIVFLVIQGKCAEYFENL